MQSKRSTGRHTHHGQDNRTKVAMPKQGGNAKAEQEGAVLPCDHHACMDKRVRLCFKDTVCCHCIFQNNKIYKEESKLVTILRKMPISFKMTFALTLTR